MRTHRDPSRRRRLMSARTQVSGNGFPDFKHGGAPRPSYSRDLPATRPIVSIDSHGRVLRDLTVDRSPGLDPVRIGRLCPCVSEGCEGAPQLEFENLPTGGPTIAIVVQLRPEVFVRLSGSIRENAHERVSHCVDCRRGTRRRGRRITHIGFHRSTPAGFFHCGYLEHVATHRADRGILCKRA